MLRMEAMNGTMASPAVSLSMDQPRKVTNGNDSHEYFYILIVLSFYGIFLMGIMLVYMKTKRRDKEANILLLCSDEERQWLSGRKTTPALSVPLSLQASSMFSALQENMIPAFSCAACSMEGSSLSSESSTSDVQITIQEESPEGLLQDVPEVEKDDDKRQIS
ncbi:potassium voltage-gated channel subfamily E member 4 [Xenopus laevis]|uniref:Potassium voltage-gated channel subfamily E member 4 n=2 Tax=Xenopus laevis TaxID=8355 RepID=A0A1L8G4H6_XENLA|nr:potassium voltage-gated channel subfamily E member 4 [Xenopus laevis]OCT78775.1 hypothetical protein XELAEV_18029865mg [Xenopus laevis]